MLYGNYLLFKNANKNLLKVFSQICDWLCHLATLYISISLLFVTADAWVEANHEEALSRSITEN